MSLYSDITITQARFLLREASDRLANYLLKKDPADNDTKELFKIAGLLEQVDRSDWNMERF